MSDPVYSSNWELVEDNIEYEYRNKTAAFVSANIVVQTTPQRREVRTKIYEASILDGLNEVPAPSYESGDNHISANPESLSPVGNDTGQWHCDGIHYAKSLSQPQSRTARVTWVKRSAWTDYDNTP